MGGAAIGQPSPDAVRATLDRVLAGEEYQTDLPGAGASAEDERSGRPAIPGGGGVGRGIDLPGEGALAIGKTIALLFAAGVVVLGLAVVAAAIRDRIARRSRGSRAAPAAPEPASAVASPFPDPDALARAGLFAEAIRALLRRAIDDLARRSGAPFPAALTSREILSRSALPGGAGESLRGLVLAVERTIFGGAGAGRAEFEAAAAAAARSVAS